MINSSGNLKIMILISAFFIAGVFSAWFSRAWLTESGQATQYNQSQESSAAPAIKEESEEDTASTTLSPPDNYTAVIQQLINTHEPAIFAQRLLALLRTYPNSNLYKEQAYWEYLASNTGLVKGIYQLALSIENPIMRQLLIEQGTFRMSAQQGREIEQYLYDHLVSGQQHSKWLRLLTPMNGVKTPRLTKLVLEKLPEYSSAADQSNAIEIGIDGNFMGHIKTETGEESEFDKLLSPYFSSPFKRVRASAMRSLRDSTRSDRGDLLIAGIFDESEMVQIRAIDAANYRKTFSPEFITEMKEIMQDPRAGFEVRYEAMEALLRTRPNQQERELYQRIRQELEPLLEEYYLQRRESLAN